MEGFPLFVMWFYLIPACASAFLGLMVVEKGKLGKDYSWLPKQSQYLSVLATAMYPGMNILSILTFLLLLSGAKIE